MAWINRMMKTNDKRMQIAKTIFKVLTKISRMFSSWNSRSSMRFSSSSILIKLDWSCSFLFVPVWSIRMVVSSLDSSGLSNLNCVGSTLIFILLVQRYTLVARLNDLPDRKDCDSFSLLINCVIVAINWAHIFRQVHTH